MEIVLIHLYQKCWNWQQSRGQSTMVWWAAQANGLDHPKVASHHKLSQEERNPSITTLDDPKVGSHHKPRSPLALLFCPFVFFKFQHHMEFPLSVRKESLYHIIYRVIDFNSICHQNSWHPSPLIQPLSPHCYLIAVASVLVLGSQTPGKKSQVPCFLSTVFFCFHMLHYHHPTTSILLLISILDM